MIQFPLKTPARRIFVVWALVLVGFMVVGCIDGFGWAPFPGYAFIFVNMTGSPVASRERRNIILIAVTALSILYIANSMNHRLPPVGRHMLWFIGVWTLLGLFLTWRGRVEPY